MTFKGYLTDPRDGALIRILFDADTKNYYAKKETNHYTQPTLIGNAEEFVKRLSKVYKREEIEQLFK